MSNQELLDLLSGTEIAIVGMAGRFPGAKNLDAYWRNLRDGVESISFFTEDELRAEGVDELLLRDPNYVAATGVLQDMEMFDGAFFGFGPRDAAIMDPQHRHFLEVSWEALEHAGYDPDRFDGSIGVFGGSGHNAYMPLNLLSNPDLLKSVGFFLLRHTGNDKDFLTTRVSYLLNLRGPSVNVQTACSTSLVAMHMAAQSLLNQECDMALAGGVTIEMPHRQGYIYHEGEVLSPDGHCRAFDDGSAGTVFGSGVGVVVLRRLEDAIADGDTIHAVLRGSAINNDGSGKMNYLAPSVDGQASAIAEALGIADVPADTISYVEAHGTGTRIGDPIEITALTQAFRATTKKKNYCGIGSVKTNIGHLDTAAGVASTIKAVMALKHKQIPPSLNFRKPNPLIDFANSPFYVNDQLRDWTPPKAGVPRRAGVSSLGVGGTNAHIVLEEAPELEPSSGSRPWQLLMLSAKTPTALEGNTQRLIEHLRANPEQNLADVAYTLQLGRQPMTHRRVIAVRDAEDAINALESKDAKRVVTQKANDTTSNTKVVFMFPGGGAQYPNMGRELYDNEPSYRDAVDECLRLLQPDLDFDLKGLMFPDEAEVKQAAEILEKRIEAALPALFITEYATAKLWLAWGIQPETFIGHSLGEYAAAHLAEVMSLKDALFIVTLRGRLFDSLPEGGMLSILLPENEIEPLLVEGTGIAVVNTPAACVVSGGVQAIEAMQQVLDARGIEYRRLRISAPAHSAVLEPILDEFYKGIAKLKFKPPTTPYITNLTGTWVKPEDAADPHYWVRHLRRTVRFADGVATLMQDTSRILLEVGPGNTLSTLTRQHPDKPANQVVLSSLRHPRETESDYQYMLTTLGRLWLSGQTADWPAFYANEQRYRVPLPTYAFDHQRFWIEPGKATFAASGQTSRQILAKLANFDDWFYRPVWQRTDLAAPENTDEKLAWLVFMDEAGLGQLMVAQLEKAGHTVIRVEPSDHFNQLTEYTYSIDPRVREDYFALVKELQERHAEPQRILHLWGVTLDKSISSRVEFFEQTQEKTFYSLLFLAQALSSEGVDSPIHMGVFSNGMQRVAAEALAYPEKATLLGAVKVIPQEFSTITAQSIDVVLPWAGTLRSAKTTQTYPLVEQLVNEILVKPADAVVAYRDGSRWVQAFEPGQVRAGQNRLRQNGVYLITGGLGGIGLVQAEYLAQAVNARLVLVGRTGLPEQAEWDKWLATHTDEDRISRQIRAVQKLEALGGEVLVVRADVGSRDQLQQAVALAEARFGAINGVIHGAGVMGDSLIPMKTTDTVERVFGPKARGTLLLDEIFEDRELDFFVLFSSTSTVVAPAGQIDYVGANAFLNAYAQSKPINGRLTAAINWGVWGEVGMAVEAQADTHALTESQSGTPMSHPLLGQRVLDTTNEIVYSAQYTVQEWILDQHRLKSGQALIPGTGYLELARAALEGDSPRRGTVEVSELFFVTPLEVKDDERREVRINLTKNDNGYHFTVTSKNAHEDDWTQHVNGKVGYSSETTNLVLPIDDLLARCNVNVVQFAPMQQFTRQEENLNFGPRWKVIRQMNFGRGEALAALELSEQFTDDLQHFRLHPALMDLATGFGLPLIEGYETINELFVPFSYGSVKIYAPLTRRAYSYARYKPDTTQNEFVLYDLTITDEEGCVLVEVSDFKMMRINPNRLTTPRPQATRRKAKQARPAETEGSKPNLLQLALTDGIMPAEGAQVFSRVITGADAQVIASSLDIKLLIDKMNAKPQAAQNDDGGLKFSRPDGIGSNYEAPRDAVEQTLAGIWQGILSIDSIGINDNFFELGGESLLGIRLFTQIKKALAVNLPLDMLFQAPTIAQMADLIRDEIGDVPAAVATEKPIAKPKRAVDSLIVPIQTQGTKPPLYLIHDQNGYVLYYRELSHRLGPDQPVYAIKAHGLNNYQLDRTIEDMAERYVAELRSFQPEGPYYLSGSSLGGLVAYDMAQKLVAAGQDVPLLAIFDSWTPENLMNWLMPPPETTSDKAFRHLRELVKRGPVGYYAQRKVNKENYQKYLEEVTELDQQRLEIQEHIKNGTTMPPNLLSFYLEEVYGEAYRNYTPKPYPGKMTLFLATERSSPRDNHPILGWDKYPPAELETHRSPGQHGFMVREPHVRVLAEQLRECIERTQAAYEQSLQRIPG